MTLKADLEHHIRESYRLIYKFEEILRLSGDPKEQARSRRAIQEQRELIRRHMTEYVPLCEHLNLAVPEDIAAIIVSSLPRSQPPSGNDSTPSEIGSLADIDTTRDHFPKSSVYQGTVEKLKCDLRETQLSFSDLEDLKAVPKRYLWGQFVLILLFLVGVLEGLVSIFDVSPCSRRSALAILTFLGGIAILGLSFLTRYRNRYHSWDRWLTAGLLLVATSALGWLAYEKCIPVGLMELWRSFY